jgi:hypothetical protein
MAISSLVEKEVEFLKRFSPVRELDRFRRAIAELAYFKAEQRGFVAGHELEDWVEAEAEVTRLWVHRTNDHDAIHR